MIRFNYLVLLLVLSACGEFAGNEDVVLGGDGSGIGGSTARFAINGNFLYVVDQTSLRVLNIEDERNPEYTASVDIGWGVETIFGYRENLFIGSQTGMHIYSIDNQGRPEYLSQFVHQRTCDPVIANDQYAYVTIRSGETCGTGLFEANQLITLDITDLRNPIDVSQQQMINPRGLTFFKGDLYVAEGAHGLKKFDLTDPARPQLVEFYQDIAANDMIGLANTMIITRDEGIFQFGCQNSELFFLSPIQ